MSTTGGGPASPVWELGPVSPELALIDPELARAARELLPDRSQPTPVHTHLAVAPVAEESAFVERLRSGLEPVPDLAPPRRRVRLARLVSAAAGLVAVTVVVTLLVGRERGPAPRQQQTQSVASAVSPSTPASTSTAPATAGSLHETPTPGHTFVWIADPQAVAYEFQLFQSGERVFRTRLDKPRLELPGHWRWSGLPHALVPGSYRWYVWPVSRRTNRRAAVALVNARLVVKKQPR